jgi:hypothetical protein
LNLHRVEVSNLQAGIVYILTFALFLFVLDDVITQQAHGDGLTQENLPPASLGNRDGSLFVKISPPIYTTTTEGDAYMQFRLFDAKTNETIPHVTYDIAVSKGANPIEDDKPLVRDFFHAHNGLLTLKVEPTNGSLTIFGDRDPFQAAYVADPGGTINLRGPVLQEGGLYRFDIQIFGVDNDRNIFVPEDAPKFETFLSVGDVFNFDNLTYEGKPFNTTLISYYDRIDDFNFNSTSGEFSWSMPFYYNVTRLEKNPIFVHEEIKLPKDLFGSSIFNATVNAQPISGRTLAIDPFTSPDAVILHYLINKNDVIKIANEWQREQGLNETAAGQNSTSTPASVQQVSLGTGNSSDRQNVTGVMKFTLRTEQPGVQTPITNGTTNGTDTQGQSASAPATSANATSTDLLSDTGGIHANVNWSPSPIRTNADSYAQFNFSDAFSGGALNADVSYDLSVLDDSGTLIFEKKGLTAKNSQDTQAIKFPTAGTYQLALTITGLQSQPEQESGTPPPVDRTRNGIARGTVVVSGQSNEPSAAPPSTPQPVPQQFNSNITGEGPETEVPQNQTVPSPASEQSNNNVTQQPQQQQNQNQNQNQTEAAESSAQTQNPLEELGQAISNMFGGGN